MNKILKWFIIGITIWCLLLLAIMPFCMAHGAEYETYFGDKFLIYHEGELGQIYIDTMIVISKTERKNEIYLRGENGNSLVIKPPDYIIKIGE